MLPASLKSIYQQYKADTDAVATWLATTAKQHGYTTIGNGPPAGGSKRPKGKARKAVQPKLQVQPASWAATTEVKNKIQQLPEYFAVAIERVIWVRKTFSQRLAAANARVNTASDGRHNYFVGVLESVRDCLKPLVEAGLYNSDRMHKATRARYTGSSKDPLSNISPDPAVEYVAELGGDLDDALFAFMTLLGDYARLRTEIKSLWAELKAGRLDLAAVSVATNAAFELARSMEDETTPLLNRKGGSGVVMEMYLRAACAVSGIDIDSPGCNCLILTSARLNGYRIANNLLSIVSCYNGKFGRYDEDLGGNATTNKKKWQQDQCAMMEFMADLDFLASNLSTGTVEDELIGGMREWMAKPSDPDFTALCRRGFDGMQQEHLRARKAMLQVPSSFSGRANILRLTTAWNCNHIWKCRGYAPGHGLLPRPPSESYESWSSDYLNPKFLCHNPLYRGLWIHNLCYTLHYQGVQYAAPSATVLGATQLYHEDLEAFMAMHGNSTFFVGNPPTDLDGYFKNYCLSTGSSIASWAPSRSQPNSKMGKSKPKKAIVNSDNRRNMKNLGLVSMHMRIRLVPTNARAPLSKELVEVILDAGRQQAVLDGKGHIRQDMKKKAKKIREQKAASANTSILTPVHPPQVRFECFVLHNACQHLLLLLKVKSSQVTGVDVSCFLPPQKAPTPELHFLVGYVFATASGHSDLNVKASDGTPVLFSAAAETMREFLPEYGHVIKDTAARKIMRDEVEDCAFPYDDSDTWGTERIFQKFESMGEAAARLSQNLDLEGCPVQ
ncbi:hypothetical protein B0H63DRAFT_504340 [Podospora didyma]|uniref:DUF6604 domain-containing protein n=1 Tax=Podospora didyma TaxID=330526 RepID=A0AAE0K373_9PEZI|nr:hypothetical protein B0H63DRAFT_504340 [Podospora didyma]